MKKLLWTLLAVLALLLVGAFINPPAFQPKTSQAPEASSKVGDTFAVTHRFLAERTESDAKKAFDLVAHHDKRALEMMALQGRLFVIESGTTVTLEGRNIFAGVDTFRASGKPDQEYAVIGEVR